ncbi:MAG: VIT1/CCC1 transporter family protein [Candidatus Latescibacteria bacterium]|nr:VIT1/CCC1 transporter family protein [Candidatus Latescibacterota bacterium]
MDAQPSSSTDETSRWLHHWQDEADAAFLYQHLAELERDPRRQQLYQRLAGVEQRHAELWKRILAERGLAHEQPSPSMRARLMLWLARRFGPSFLLPMLFRDEGHETRNYLALYRRSGADRTRDTAYTLAKESAQHARTLGELVGAPGEPWHHLESGGILRNVVYGFNDGLTANFGLVAGVIGAAVDPHLILVTGLAGTLADALSMGSSGYLAAKSEQEVYTHEIAIEREELRLMPELEEEELTLIYAAKGMDEGEAKELARRVMADPERALEELITNELQISPPRSSPMKEGWITGTATAVGALIPVAPFLLLQGEAAIWLSFASAMLAHFAVGAARSVFTGLSLLRSGLEMLGVGMGVAALGYVVGDVLVRWL